MFDRLQHLNAVDRSEKHDIVEPRDAASLIIIDRRGPAPVFLMGQRTPRQKFMPGVFVFPGGALELNDIGLAAAAAPHHTAATSHITAGPLSPKSPLNCHERAIGGAALAICALREMTEETGFALPGGESGERACSADRPLETALGDMHLLARAITPPGRRYRYDTRFLITEIINDLEESGKSDDEFSKLTWVDYDTAISELPLHAMTRVIIEDLHDFLESLSPTLAIADQRPSKVPHYQFEKTEFKRELIEF